LFSEKMPVLRASITLTSPTLPTDPLEQRARDQDVAGAGALIAAGSVYTSWNRSTPSP
jgi:hypothetical protein